MSEVLTKKILVLGSRWSGKSFLIKRFEDLCSTSKISTDEFVCTTATLGKTVTPIKYKRNHTFELHELGGTMSCLWKSIYTKQLKEITEQIPIKHKNVLLIFNKTNEINSLTKAALMELLDIDTVWNGDIDIIETNARLGTNLTAVLDWLTR
ncbi:unnamed protein product [Adineta ricciae]|uniref:Uncharacterized protein n=1 Tax=Adineta ricciae TaxID=249248 RepID=A0A813WEV8_ADIRI|nr:unnamed protein product [Adineta ricciae]